MFVLIFHNYCNEQNKEFTKNMRRLTSFLVFTVSFLFLLAFVFFAFLSFNSSNHYYENYISQLDAVQKNASAISPLEYSGFQHLSQQKNSKKLLRAYNKIAEGVQHCDPNIKVFDIWDPLTIEDIQLVSLCYIMDYPQTFWIDNHYTLSIIENLDWVISIQFNYFFSAEELPAEKNKFDEAVSLILENTDNLSDIEKEIYIHDYISENVTYSTDTTKRLVHSAYSAVIDGNAVCDGQSKLFLHLMRESGIPCMIIYGSVNGLEHAWNAVEIGGSYYNVDVTWDGCKTALKGEISYSYFNLTTEEISKTHMSLKCAYNYPDCTTVWAGKNN